MTIQKALHVLIIVSCQIKFPSHLRASMVLHKDSQIRTRFSYSNCTIDLNTYGSQTLPYPTFVKSSSKGIHQMNTSFLRKDKIVILHLIFREIVKYKSIVYITHYDIIPNISKIGKQSPSLILGWPMWFVQPTNVWH